jgi:omega-amidase
MKDLQVALLQNDIYWEEIDANLAQFEEQIWKIDDQVDLIVLPEMFTTGFTMSPKKIFEPVNGRTMTWMRQMADQTKAVVMGSHVVNDGGTFRNRMSIIKPDGSYTFYDKKHLFGLAGEDAHYQRGKERVIVDIAGWRIMPLICYDLRFPVWARSRKAENQLYEYDLMVYVANWPSPRVHAWDTLLQARAIENQCYVVGVNRTGEDELKNTYPGRSGVYNYLGETVAVMNNNPGTVIAKLEGEEMTVFRNRYPFQADADDFDLK